MKKLAPIFFFLAVALFVIGIHQSIVVGLSESYWIFMICLSLLFLYGYQKNQNNNDHDKQQKKKKSAKKSRS